MNGPQKHQIAWFQEQIATFQKKKKEQIASAYKTKIKYSLVHSPCYCLVTSHNTTNREKKEIIIAINRSLQPRELVGDGWTGEILLPRCAAVHGHGGYGMHQRGLKHTVQSSYFEGDESLCFCCLFLWCCCSCSSSCPFLLLQVTYLCMLKFLK